MQIKHKVTATVKDEHGNIIQQEINHNAVTDGDPNTQHNGFVWVLDKIFGDGAYYDPADTINKMELGSTITSAPEDGLDNPLSPSTLEAFASTAWDISTPTAPSITATTDWDSSYGAFTTIKEVALMVDGIGSVMIAHQSFATTLSKGTGDTFTIQWEITIS